MTAHWPQYDIPGRIRATGEAIIEIAVRQRQLIRLDQLRACDLGDRGVQHRVSRGRLYLVYPRVYAIHPAPYSQPQRRLAATFTCGPLSMISDLTAAVHLGLEEHEAPGIHVTCPTRAGRRVPGLTIHRRSIDPRDAWRVDGIPCTSAARTIVDCAHVAGLDGTERMIMAADASGRLNRARLEELVAEHRGQPGIARVRALIADDPVELRNENERRMFSICRDFGIPRPLANHRIDVGGRTFYADFCWPGLGLIVEADSWRWHGGRLAGERDADRDQLLSIAGWRVVHFTRDQIKRERERTGRRLLALTRGSASSS